MTRVARRTTAVHRFGQFQTAMAVVGFCLVAAALPTTAIAQQVSIPDERLRAAIEQALDKNSGEAITEAEMESLTELRAEYDDIKDLTGLEHATGLTELHLAYNDIADLAPLSGLASLEVLGISHNGISDVTPLGD